jgi:hypothetical protein
VTPAAVDVDLAIGSSGPNLTSVSAEAFKAYLDRCATISCIGVEPTETHASVWAAAF